MSKSKIDLIDPYINHHEWTKNVKVTKKGRLLLEKIDIALDENDISEYDKKQLIIDKKVIAQENKRKFWFYILIFFLVTSVFGCVLIPVIW